MAEHRILLAVPLFGSHCMVSMQLARTLWDCSRQFQVVLGSLGWGEKDVEVTLATTVTGFAHARGDIVRRFLEDERHFTHLWWWDSDEDPTDTKTAIELVSAMLKADRDWVACPSVEKHYFWERGAAAVLAHGRDLLDLAPQSDAREQIAKLFRGYAVRYVPDLTKIPLGEKVAPDLYEIGRLNLAFALMKRSMLATMWQYYAPRLSYRSRSTDPRSGLESAAEEAHVALFHDPLRPADRSVDGRRLLAPAGEDYAFADRWRELGGKMHLYLGPGTPLGHIGQEIYRGDRDAMLESARQR
jgi:hypothetical protein